MDWGKIYTGIAGIGGAAASYFFGGWPMLIIVLVGIVILDYVSGVLAAAIEGKLSSSIGLKGLAKKVFIFLLVATAHLVDTAIGKGDMVRDGVTWCFIANEALSIVENSGRTGLVPIPPILRQAVEVLKNKGGGSLNG